MTKFYRTLMSVIAAVFLLGWNVKASADATIQIDVTDITINDATISVSPSGVSSYYFNVKTKADYDAAGGDAGAFEDAVQIWESYADQYGGYWTEYADFSYGAKTENLRYLVNRVIPGTEYVVYAFGIDYQGNMTTEVFTTTFSTLAPTIPLKIEVTNIQETDATVTVTPDGVSSYFYNIQSKADYDAAGGDDGAVAARKAIWENYATQYGGHWTEYVDYKYSASSIQADDILTLQPGTEYVVYAFGIDYQGNITTSVFTNNFTTLAPILPFDIEITDIQETDATVTVTPVNVSSYFYNIQSKADYDAAGGDNGAVAARKAIWENYATQFGGYWTEYVDYKYRADAIQADDILTLQPGTEYVVYAFGIDYQGNITTSVVSKTFTTLAPPTPFNIEITDIQDTDATVTVTPVNVSSYFYNIQSKVDYDAAGGDNGAVAARKAIWENYATQFGGYWTEYVDYKYRADAIQADDILTLQPGTEYVVYAFGIDYQGNITTPVVSKTFTTLSNILPASAISVEVSDITINNASVTVTPVDVPSYFYSVMSKADYDAAGGDDGVIEARINIWKKYGETYSSPWTDFIDPKYYAVTEDASLILDLEPDTEYVAYAFGIDAKGNILSLVNSVTFRTLEAPKSDITFDIEVLTIEPDSNGTCTITARVTASNDDPYGVVCLEAKYINQYDLTDPAQMKTMISRQITPNIRKTYTGTQELTFVGQPYNQSMYLVAIGFDKVVNSDPELLAFKSLPLLGKDALNIEVSDITVNDAKITVTMNGVESYYTTVMEKEIYDQRGGDEGAIDARIEIWKSYGATYHCPWQDFIDPKYYPQSYFASDILDLEAGKEYVAYAFGIDADGNILCPVVSEVFKAKEAYKSDIKFRSEITSIAYDGSGYAVTVHVVPSNNDSYAVKCMQSKFVEGYDMTDPEAVQQFLSRQFTPGVSQTYTGTKEIVFSDQPYGEKLYIVLAGFDDVPTSDPTLISFECVPYTKKDDFTLSVSEITSDDAYLSIVPEDADQHYIWGVVPADYVESIGGSESLYENYDLAGWKEKAASLGIEWQDVASGAQKYGTIEGNYSQLTDLKLMEETDYVLYAYTLDADYQQASVTYFREFKTTKDTSAAMIQDGDVTVAGAQGRILVRGEYDVLGIFTADGKAIGTYHNTAEVEMPAGLYIVTIQRDGHQASHKVIVR